MKTNCVDKLLHTERAAVKNKLRGSMRPTPSDSIVEAGTTILENLRAKGFTDREILGIGDYIVLASVVELANSTGAWQVGRQSTRTSGPLGS